jgi:hypothetical protein
VIKWNGTLDLSGRLYQIHLVLTKLLKTGLHTKNRLKTLVLPFENVVPSHFASLRLCVKK